MQVENLSSRISINLSFKDLFNSYSDIGNYRIQHNMNLSISHPTIFNVYIYINGTPYDISHFFKRVEDKPNYLFLECSKNHILKCSQLDIKRNSPIEIHVYETKTLKEINEEHGITPKKQWLEERYYKIIHILNESKTMSIELLKECEWLAGELLKERD